MCCLIVISQASCPVVSSRVCCRLLEEGKIQEAENAKLHVEKQQRDRRKQREVDGSPYTPKWFLYVSSVFLVFYFSLFISGCVYVHCPCVFKYFPTMPSLFKFNIFVQLVLECFHDRPNLPCIQCGMLVHVNKHI